MCACEANTPNKPHKRIKTLDNSHTTQLSYKHLRKMVKYLMSNAHIREGMRAIGKDWPSGTYYWTQEAADWALKSPDEQREILRAAVKKAGPAV